jgi:hemerythrin-like domain-containing protein
LIKKYQPPHGWFLISGLKPFFINFSAVSDADLTLNESVIPLPIFRDPCRVNFKQQYFNHCCSGKKAVQNKYRKTGFKVCSKNHNNINNAECVHTSAPEKRKIESAFIIHVNFFRNFADIWHHTKEENTLFVLMEKEGLKGAGGNDYIRLLLSEHTIARGLVKGMNESFREAAHGDIEKVMEFSGYARDYIDLIKGHILKEDRIVFPFAMKNLRADVIENLANDFKTAEGKVPTEHSGVVYRKMAISLSFVYNENIPERIKEETGTF